MSIEEINAELADANDRESRLKLDHVIKGLENPLSIRSVRRTIAQLKTELRQRELGQMDTDAQASRSRIRQRRRLNK